MDVGWIENARAAFIRLYGKKRGGRVCDAVIPGVLADFRKMLAQAAPGIPVRETYHIDDGRGDVVLEGHRTEAGSLLTHLTVGGAEVDLGGSGLPL